MFLFCSCYLFSSALACAFDELASPAFYFTFASGVCMTRRHCFFFLHRVGTCSERAWTALA